MKPNTSLAERIYNLTAMGVPYHSSVPLYIKPCPILKDLQDKKSVAYVFLID